MAEPNESNPYRSPSSAGTPTEPVRKRFPWRIVPVIILYLYGGLLVLESVASCGWGVFFRVRYFGSSILVWGTICAWFLLGVHGCLAIAMGRHLWKQRWRRSVVTFAWAIVLLILAAGTWCILFVLVHYRLNDTMGRWHEGSRNSAERRTEMIAKPIPLATRVGPIRKS